MGFMATADPPPQYLTVATAMGKASRLDADGKVLETWAKARLFVLEDRTAVLVVAGSAPRTVIRTVHQTVASTWSSRSRQLTVVLENGEILALNGQGCGCNMGAVGNAGPADGQYRLVRVRAPEWHTVER